VIDAAAVIADGFDKIAEPPRRMENAETIPPVASRQRAHRSAVSNGTRLFCVDGLDGRSHAKCSGVAANVRSARARAFSLSESSQSVSFWRLGSCSCKFFWFFFL